MVGNGANFCPWPALLLVEVESSSLSSTDVYFRISDRRKREHVPYAQDCREQIDDGGIRTSSNILCVGVYP